MAKSKISNTEWGLIIAALFVVDAIQLLLLFFVIGLATNEFIDIFVGMAFPFYLVMRGENLLNWKRISVFIGSYLGDAVTDGALPLWGLDGIAQMLFSKAEEKLEQSPIAGKVVSITKGKLPPGNNTQKPNDMDKAA